MSLCSVPRERRAAFGSGALRIVHVVEAALAGVGRHVLDLAKAQEDEGHRVDVIYSPKRADAWFVDEASTLARSLRMVDMATAPSFGDRQSLSAVNQALADLGAIDILHGHSFKGGLLARLATTIGEPARIYTPNAIKTLDRRASPAVKAGVAAIELALARVRTDAIIAVSQDEVSHLRALGLGRERTAYVPNGTAALERRARPWSRPMLKAGADDVVALFVGRLVPQKDPLRLLEAVASIPADRRGRLQVRILGTGPLLVAAKRRIAERGLDPHVRLLGDGIGVDAMAAADMLVCTSVYEGFPYVLVEALQSGLPVVTTPIGGHETLVLPGETGLVAGPDAAALGQALQQLSSDAHMRAGMSERARHHGQAFTASAMAASTERVYRAAMEGRRSRFRPDRSTR